MNPGILSTLSLIVLGATGCVASQQEVTRASQAQGLLIQGYNYTDTHIDSFTVNGVGGGNVFVSSPTTGGGKSACCYSFDPLSNARVTIRWAASYCMYTATNKYGETYQWRKSLFREDVIPVEGLGIREASALEVHFYPDGHVEAAITAGHSPPRLQQPITADEQRPGASRNFPPCAHEQLQQGR
ncbi:MAG: DUF3304 domain-containing protein [Aquabacterium sp.]